MHNIIYTWFVVAKLLYNQNVRLLEMGKQFGNIIKDFFRFYLSIAEMRKASIQ